MKKHKCNVLELKSDLFLVDIWRGQNLIETKKKYNGLETITRKKVQGFIHFALLTFFYDQRSNTYIKRYKYTGPMHRY